MSVDIQPVQELGKPSKFSWMLSSYALVTMFFLVIFFAYGPVRLNQLDKQYNRTFDTLKRVKDQHAYDVAFSTLVNCSDPVLICDYGIGVATKLDYFNQVSRMLDLTDFDAKRPALQGFPK